MTIDYLQTACIGIILLFILGIYLNERWKQKHWHPTGEEAPNATSYNGSIYGNGGTKSDDDPNNFFNHK